MSLYGKTWNRKKKCFSGWKISRWKLLLWEPISALCLENMVEYGSPAVSESEKIILGTRKKPPQNGFKIIVKWPKWQNYIDKIPKIYQKSQKMTKIDQNRPKMRSLTPNSTNSGSMGEWRPLSQEILSKLNFLPPKRPFFGHFWPFWTLGPQAGGQCRAQNGKKKRPQKWPFFGNYYFFGSGISTTERWRGVHRIGQLRHSRYSFLRKKK